MNPVILPIVMTLNEERFIRQTLTPLSNVFPVVIVADTGSTDDALEEMAKVSHLHMVHYDHPDMETVGKIRGYLAWIAKQLGATHVIQVDGDEIYPTKYLQYLLDNPMPEGMVAGYTTGVECAELQHGEIWRYDTDFNRCAVFSVDSPWRGAWPFESPLAWDPDHPETQYHWPRTERWQNFYHMHHLVRSRKDHEVNGRIEYRNLFALQTKPELQPATFLLKSWQDYEDVK